MVSKTDKLKKALQRHESRKDRVEDLLIRSRLAIHRTRNIMKRRKNLK